MNKLFFLEVAALLAMACFALAPRACAVDPPPDGGYPNGNTVEGEDALFGLTATGLSHTAVGFHAIHNLLGDAFSTAVGALALSTRDDPFGPNTAIGFQTLLNDGRGDNNTAVGSNALLSNHGDNFGFNNQAVGANALGANTKGVGNSAIGSGALQHSEGGNNCAFGYNTMQAGARGGANVAMGDSALLKCNGNDNVALGVRVLAGLTDISSTNIAIGYKAGGGLRRNGNDNIHIGHRGQSGDTNTIRIGEPGVQTATFIAGISGVPVAGGVGVVIDANDQLGTLPSNAASKEAIKPIGKASEVIYALQPVSFSSRKEVNPEAIPQFGLVTKQVKKAAPELVARDDKGEAYSVRYQAVNAMLLNEFLKQHRQGEQQDAMIKAHKSKVEQLEATVANLQAAVQEQIAELQKTSEQLQAIRVRSSGPGFSGR